MSKQIKVERMIERIIQIQRSEANYDDEHGNWRQYDRRKLVIQALEDFLFNPFQKVLTTLERFNQEMLMHHDCIVCGREHAGPTAQPAHTCSGCSHECSNA